MEILYAKESPGVLLGGGRPDHLFCSYITQRLDRRRALSAPTWRADVSGQDRGVRRRRGSGVECPDSQLRWREQDEEALEGKSTVGPHLRLPSRRGVE